MLDYMAELFQAIGSTNFCQYPKIMRREGIIRSKRDTKSVFLLEYLHMESILHLLRLLRAMLNSFLLRKTTESKVQKQPGFI